MNSIEVKNTETGEVTSYKGKMMVATNGVIFIKDGKTTVWASGSPVFVVEAT